jgi:hypothetical protein
MQKNHVPGISQAKMKDSIQKNNKAKIGLGANSSGRAPA